MSTTSSSTMQGTPVGTSKPTSSESSGASVSGGAAVYAGNTKTGYTYDNQWKGMASGVAASVPGAAAIYGPAMLTGAGAHMLDASGTGLQAFQVSQCAFGSPFSCTPFQKAVEAPRPAAGGKASACFVAGVTAKDVHCQVSTAQECYDAGGVFDGSAACPASAATF